MNLHLIITFVVVPLIMLTAAPSDVSRHSLGKKCIDHYEKDGTCKLISDCANLNFVHDLYKIERNFARHEILLSNRMSCNSTESSDFIVCCMNEEVRSKSGDAPTGKACVTPDSETTAYRNLPGICNYAGYCPAILEEYSRKKELGDQVELEYAEKTIHQSHISCESYYQFICCPTDPQLEPEAIPEAAKPRLSPFSETVASELSPAECGKVKVYERTRIAGGDDSPLGVWPWMALYGRGSTLKPTFSCGGSIITKRHVLTAAHCLLGEKNNSLVRLGVHDITVEDSRTRTIKVARYLSHENYDDAIKHNDIAILLLVQEIIFTDFIAPICLSLFENLSNTTSRPYIAGWGRTTENGFSSGILQYATVPLVPNNQCREAFEKENKKFVSTKEQFNEGVICAGEVGIDSCQGDSGGPLMSQETDIEGKLVYYQIGIVAFGIGCGREGLPGVYTSVHYFADWIRLHVEGESI